MDQLTLQNKRELKRFRSGCPAPHQDEGKPPRAGASPQGRGKPCPYYIRVWQADRAELPCTTPRAGASPRGANGSERLKGTPPVQGFPESAGGPRLETTVAHGAVAWDWSRKSAVTVTDMLAPEQKLHCPSTIARQRLVQLAESSQKLIGRRSLPTVASTSPWASHCSSSGK